MYDELIHVPFIVKPPAEYDTVDAIEDLTAYLDIGPTFLDLAGTSAPDEMEGQSFLDALENGKTEREAVISEYANSGKRITSRRTLEWKYILDDYHDREELFDLTTDSTEQTDCSTDRPEVLESFRDAVRERMSHEEFDTDASFDDDVDEEMRQQLEDLGYL
ncbi:arylsulfatase A family protein [Halogeometricum borinquense DSM 11551]|uniref:Arylsulfatase A family protein n=1 Tax=Halogeometricum borinquense (strain ATCC 700274 / DSM 11551 / JCM 10706 / KCTC 4070 / PR3) TaxID=469382 RepID=E4NM80_HALBP|nr:arylsulfatase A family protein [Halogeometricum borinquense DSM 11551]